MPPGPGSPKREALSCFPTSCLALLSWTQGDLQPGAAFQPGTGSQGEGELGKQHKASVLCSPPTQTKLLTWMPRAEACHPPGSAVPGFLLEVLITWFSFIICMSWSSSGLLRQGDRRSSVSRPRPYHLSSLGLLKGVPDAAVFLLLTEVSVLGKKDGVVGHGRLTCGQDAPNQVTYHGKNAIVHQQVIYEQLRDRAGMRPWPLPCLPQPCAMHPSAVPSPSFLENLG